MASPACAEGLEPGYWKIISTPEVNGAPAAPQEKLRCMSPAETSDLGKTVSPEANTVNATCERVEHVLTPSTMTWRPDRTRRGSMDVAGALKFETPQRYVAEVRTQMTIAGQTVRSRVKIEGERVGECP